MEPVTATIIGLAVFAAAGLGWFTYNRSKNAQSTSESAVPTLAATYSDGSGSNFETSGPSAQFSVGSTSESPVYPTGLDSSVDPSFLGIAGDVDVIQLEDESIISGEYTLVATEANPTPRFVKQVRPNHIVLRTLPEGTTFDVDGSGRPTAVVPALVA